MFNRHRNSLLFAAMLVFASPAVGGELIFDYAGFYHKLKTAGQSEYADAKLSFRLIRKGTDHACDITSGLIKAGDRQYPLVFSDNGIMHLPFDKDLKDSRAKIQTQFNDLACDLQMRIEARSPKASYAYPDLKHLQDQLHGLMRELAGVMSFFLATPDGLVAHMPSENASARWSKLETPLKTGKLGENQIEIRLTDGLSRQTLTFNQKPQSITLLLVR